MADRRHGELPPRLNDRKRTFLLSLCFVYAVLSDTGIAAGIVNVVRDAREERSQEKTKEQCGPARLTPSVDPNPKI
jgi:hypothetical protein